MLPDPPFPASERARHANACLTTAAAALPPPALAQVADNPKIGDYTAGLLAPVLAAYVPGAGATAGVSLAEFWAALLPAAAAAGASFAAHVVASAAAAVATDAAFAAAPGRAALLAEVAGGSASAAGPAAPARALSLVQLAAPGMGRMRRLRAALEKGGEALCGGAQFAVVSALAEACAPGSALAAAVAEGADAAAEDALVAWVHAQAPAVRASAAFARGLAAEATFAALQAADGGGAEAVATHLSRAAKAPCPSCAPRGCARGRRCRRPSRWGARRRTRPSSSP